MVRTSFHPIPAKAERSAVQHAGCLRDHPQRPWRKNPRTARYALVYARADTGAAQARERGYRPIVENAYPPGSALRDLLADRCCASGGTRVGIEISGIDAWRDGFCVTARSDPQRRASGAAGGSAVASIRRQGATPSHENVMRNANRSSRSTFSRLPNSRTGAPNQAWTPWGNCSVGSPWYACLRRVSIKL